MAGLGGAAAAADGDQPFMVSALPLVFCDGRPVALENMPDVSYTASAGCSGGRAPDRC